MLPKKRRIDKKLFNKVFETGRDYSSASFYIKVLKLTDDEESRFAFAVPNKVSKKAVTRIMLKRRGFSVLKDLLSDVKPSFACIFFVRKEAKNIDSLELKEEIVSLLKKASIL